MPTYKYLTCAVCGRTFTLVTPAGNIPGHGEQGKLCAGSYQPPRIESTEEES